jgi:hypothetical protein
MSAADSGVDLGLSPSGGGSSVWQLVPVVEFVKQATVLPPLSASVLFPPVLLSDPPSRVRSFLDLSSSGSRLIHRQAVVLPSVGSDLVRSGVEDYQFGKPGALSGGAGHVEFRRPSEGSIVSGAPSGSFLRQAVVHSDALAW